mmetsp:Transcript_53177/g.158443  ORF Transcript_53177/g.158443 Transcript_53177/m.158443 type:complete len:273 (-) Transcript_53177:967-1785(-)
MGGTPASWPFSVSCTAARHSSMRPQASGGEELSASERCWYQWGSSGSSSLCRAATACAPMEKPATFRRIAWPRSSASHVLVLSGEVPATSSRQYGKSMVSLGAVAAGSVGPLLNCTFSSTAMHTPRVLEVSPWRSTREMPTAATGESGAFPAVAATSRAKPSSLSWLPAGSAACAESTASAASWSALLDDPLPLAGAPTGKASGASSASDPAKACLPSAEAAPSRSTSPLTVAPVGPASGRPRRTWKPARPSLSLSLFRSLSRYSGKPGESR